MITLFQTCAKNPTNPNKPRTAPPRADGLVGFLHNPINEGRTQKIVWKDEDYYSNAAVEDGEKTPNGS